MVEWLNLVQGFCVEKKNCNAVFLERPSPLRQESYITVCSSRVVKPKLFKFVVWNPCQSSPSLTILVSL